MRVAGELSDRKKVLQAVLRQILASSATAAALAPRHGAARRRR